MKRSLRSVALPLFLAGAAAAGLHVAGAAPASANGCNPYLGPNYGASCFVQTGSNQYAGVGLAAGNGVDASAGLCVSNTPSINCQLERVYTDSGHVVYEHCTGIYMNSCTRTVIA
jgi:hypothetical protein